MPEKEGANNAGKYLPRTPLTHKVPGSSWAILFRLGSGNMERIERKRQASEASKREVRSGRLLGIAGWASGSGIDWVGVMMSARGGGWSGLGSGHIY
jgi:hypothetical protein